MFKDVETYKKMDEIVSIARRGVRIAQDRCRALGVPLVYTINGRRYYELPNGDIVRELPEEERKKHNGVLSP